MKTETVIREPKSPEIGDSVIRILKHIESYSQRATPDVEFKDGKMVPYIGPKMFVQYIRVFVIFYNGSSFEDKMWNDLSEEDVHNFPEAGYFEKIDGEWKEITKDEYYVYFLNLSI